MLFFASLAAGFWLASALAGTAVLYGAVLPPDRVRDGLPERR